MPNTSKGLRYPASSAAPNVPQDIQNLATDVNTALPGRWVRAFDGDTSYIFSPAGTADFEPLPGLSGITTPVVPSGRDLDIRFDAPTGQCAGGFIHVRLLVNGGEIVRNIFSEGWAPVNLLATTGGLGATVTLRVEAWRTAGTGDVRGTGSGVHLGYRIV